MASQLTMTMALPKIMKGLGFLQTQFVKSVVGESFYTQCTTNTYVREMLLFCVQDVEKTAALMERIKVVNHKNVQNNTAQFTRIEYRKIGRRIQQINDALTHVSSTTLQELEEMDFVRTEVVNAFVEGSFEVVDEKLAKLYGKITSTMNHMPRASMSVYETISYGAVKLMQWHFFLLSVHLKSVTSTQVPAVVGFLKSLGMSKVLINRLVPIISTGLIAPSSGYGSRYTVTRLYAEHPWDTLVSWVSEAAGYIAGRSSSFAMSTYLMGVVRQPLLVTMILIFFLLAIVFRKKAITRAVEEGMQDGVNIVHRALAISHTNVLSVYSAVSRHMNKQRMTGLRKHTVIGPRRASSVHNSFGSIEYEKNL